MQLMCQQSMDTLLELIDRGHLPDHATAASTFEAVQLCCHHAVCMLSPHDAHDTDMAITLLEKVFVVFCMWGVGVGCAYEQPPQKGGMIPAANTKHHYQTSGCHAPTGHQHG